MNRLAGKRVLITGASAGIGEACARSLASHGAHLLLSARRLEKVEALANALREEYGVEAHAAAVDVADKQVVTDYVANLVSEGLVPDVLINNAGKARGFDKLHEGSLDDWDDMIDTNVKGLLYMSRAIIPLMVERDSGHIINIGSISAQMPRMNSAPYSTTKHALVGLTKSTALEGRDFGVVASILHPGNVLTELRDNSALAQNQEPMMSTDDIAMAALTMAALPLNVNMLESIVLPVEQKYIGRG